MIHKMVLLNFVIRDNKNKKLPAMTHRLLLRRDPPLRPADHSPSDSFLPMPAVALRSRCPISVDPVKPTLSTSGCVASFSPIEPGPVTTLNTPGGRLQAGGGRGQRGASFSPIEPGPVTTLNTPGGRLQAGGGRGQRGVREGSASPPSSPARSPR